MLNITDKDALLIGVKFSGGKSPEACQIKYNYKEEDIKKRFVISRHKPRTCIIPADNDLEERRPYNMDEPLNNPVVIDKLNGFIEDYLAGKIQG